MGISFLDPPGGLGCGFIGALSLGFWVVKTCMEPKVNIALPRYPNTPYLIKEYTLNHNIQPTLFKVYSLIKGYWVLWVSIALLPQKTRLWVVFKHRIVLKGKIGDMLPQSSNPDTLNPKPLNPKPKPLNPNPNLNP